MSMWRTSSSSLHRSHVKSVAAAPIRPVGILHHLSTHHDIDGYKNLPSAARAIFEGFLPTCEPSKSTMAKCTVDTSLTEMAHSAVTKTHRGSCEIVRIKENPERLMTCKT